MSDVTIIQVPTLNLNVSPIIANNLIITAQSSVQIAISSGSGGGGASLGNAVPLGLGVASAGVSTLGSRQDHVHALPTAVQLGLSTVATSGSYADLSGKPTIPSLTSQLVNDSGFLTVAPVTSVAGKTGIVTLTKSDVGLANVDNTTDLNKPVSTATQTALNLKQDTLPSGGNGLFLNKTSGGVLGWQAPRMNPRERVELFDDFLSASNNANHALGWSYQALGTGAGFLAGPNRGNVFGLCQLSTGTTATGRCSVLLTTSALYFGLGLVEISFRFQTLAASSVAESFVSYFGFIDNAASGDSVDGVYFSHTHTESGGRWQLNTINNSTKTSVDSGVNVAAFGTFQVLKIIVSADGNLASFYIDDVLVGTISTNIPASSARVLGPGMKIEKLAGTTNRTHEVDWFYMYLEMAR